MNHAAFCVTSSSMDSKPLTGGKKVVVYSQQEGLFALPLPLPLPDPTSPKHVRRFEVDVLKSPTKRERPATSGSTKVDKRNKLGGTGTMAYTGLLFLCFSVSAFSCSQRSLDVLFSLSLSLSLVAFD